MSDDFTPDESIDDFLDDSESSVPNSMYEQPAKTNASTLVRRSDVTNDSIIQLFDAYDFVFDTTDSAPSSTMKKMSIAIKPYVLAMDDDFTFAIDRIPSRDTITRNVTETVLDLNGAGARDAVSPDDLTAQVINELNNTFSNYNCAICINTILKTGKSANGFKLGTKQFDTINTLDPVALSCILRRYHHIIRIKPSSGKSDPDADLLAVYIDDPEDPAYGTYATNSGNIRSLALRYVDRINKFDLEDLRALIYENAPRVNPSMNRDLVPCNNGIFRYDTKEFHDFDPGYVFVNKLATNFIHNAPNPIIHNDDDGTDWNVIDWMNEISGDPQIEKALWEHIGAVFRPYVMWGKCALYHATSGNNGKGSILALIRNITGPSYHTSIPLAEFGQDFKTHSLLSASAVLVDENDVGDYLKNNATLKAVITGDVIRINQKHVDPIDYTFHGFMIQCLNDRPRFRDTSDSIYRRFLVIPFYKSFTGIERKYIKDDYLKRREVREFVLWYTLAVMPDYYELSEPDVSRAELEEFKDDNDPVRAFWNEMSELLESEFLPRAFLYECYKAWQKANSPQGRPVSQQTFHDRIQGMIRSNPSPAYKPYLNSSGQMIYKRLRKGTMLHEPEMSQYSMYIDNPTWQMATVKPISIGDKQYKGYTCT